jgi:hypothetical protein
MPSWISRCFSEASAARRAPLGFVFLSMARSLSSGVRS